MRQAPAAFMERCLRSAGPSPRYAPHNAACSEHVLAVAQGVGAIASGAILDKTGTLTHGSAAIVDIRTAGATISGDEVLRLAASLDQASGHVVAATLIEAARQRGLVLSPPTDVHETPGIGLDGMAEGKSVVGGGNSYVRQRSGGDDPYSLHDGLSPEVMTVAVAVDGVLAASSSSKISFVPTQVPCFPACGPAA